jgi:hypothetical protein
VIDDATLKDMFTRISEEDGNADQQFFDTNPTLTKRQFDWVNRTTSMKARKLKNVENRIFEEDEQDEEEIDFTDLYDEKYFDDGTQEYYDTGNQTSKTSFL